MRKYIQIAAILVLALLSSCQKQSTQFHIGVSQCSVDAWRQWMNSEIAREINMLQNVDVTFASTNDDSERQIDQIDSLVNLGVDLLVISPNDVDLVTPAIERAYDRGVYVILADRKINSEKYNAFIGADNFQIGYNAGVYVAGKLNGTGKVVELKGSSSSSPANERHRGFTEALANFKNIEITHSIHCDWSSEIASRKVDSLIKQRVIIDAIFAHNDFMAQGASEVAREFAAADKMLFVGVDALPNNGVAQIIEGNLDASFIYPTAGGKIVELAMNILQNRAYLRENNLTTALVDGTNAKILKMQNDHIQELDGKIGSLSSQIDHYIVQHSSQRGFLYASIIIILLFASMLTIIFRAYWTKSKINTLLHTQKSELERQRDKLVSLSEQLEEATKAKLMFFTNISHDFRTPLTLISDPVNRLLKDDKIDGSQRTLLRLVNKNTSILLRLVNQVLDFRKYESGKMKLNLSRVDLKKQLVEWSSSFVDLAARKHINFNVESDASYDYIMALDVEKIERVYFNLLSNAFKFTPSLGEISTHLSVIEDPIQGKCVRLTIADTGAGFSPELINNIFDRFYQVDTNHEGSGIGLALVKSFVELHDGVISAKSCENRGTTFTVDLPIRDVSGENAEYLPAQISNDVVLEELSVIENQEIDINENRACVLIIDDNDDVRCYIKLLLSDKYAILEARNGAEGIKLATKYLPDVVICDVMMPVVNGFEFCAQIKSTMQTSHIPIILLTAHSQEELKIDGYNSGADSYLLKPFNSDLLISRVENMILNHKRLKHFFADETTISNEPITEMDKGFVSRFKSLLDEHISETELSVEELGRMMGLSRVQLYRKIKSLTSYSPNELVRIARLKKAASLLLTTDRTISEITYDVGFSSSSYMAKCFKDHFGVTPTEYVASKK